MPFMLAMALLFGAFFEMSPDVSAQGAGQQLPLKSGRYGVGGCNTFNETGTYIVVGIHHEGEKRGRQFIVPLAERQEGYCTIEKLAPLGPVLSGVARCDSGTRSNPAALGQYRFNYLVHDALSFTSLGKRYQWCSTR